MHVKSRRPDSNLIDFLEGEGRSIRRENIIIDIKEKNKTF